MACLVECRTEHILLFGMGDGQCMEDKTSTTDLAPSATKTPSTPRVLEHALPMLEDLTYCNISGVNVVCC